MRRRILPVSLPPAMPMPAGVASFPRKPGGANAKAATRAAAQPLLNVYEPPIQQQVPALPAMPPTGVTEDAEVRTFTAPWLNNGTNLITGREVNVYTTTRPWEGLDVYFQSPSPVPAGIVLSVRVYSVSGTGPPTLVDSGRVGAINGGVAMRAPLWICAARAQSERFLVTFELSQRFGAVGPVAFGGEEWTITVVGSNRCVANPLPLSGAIPMDPLQGIAATARFTTGDQPELLMVQGTAGPAVAAPRFLHVHSNISPVIAGQAPMFSFPMGLGTTGGKNCTIWFPRGLRPAGLNALDMWIVAESSTLATTTLTGDCIVGGLYR